MSFIFVDCEAYGGCPRTGQLTEFGAVEFKTGESFHGILVKSSPNPKNPAVPLPVEKPSDSHCEKVFQDFASWLQQYEGRPIFVSDNPAFDFMWIADGFHVHFGYNPFGHSARRISDYYAGLMKDFSKTQGWKKLRITPHDHNPVNDARGNLEAFRRLQAGER